MASSDSVPARPRIHAACREDVPAARYCPLLLIPQSGSLQLVALNPAVTRMATHYDTANNDVHWCDESPQCPRCRKGQPNRMSRYLPVLSLNDNRQYLLAIPSQAYLYATMLQKLDGDLRGRMLTGVRTRAGKRGPVKIEVSEKRVPDDRLVSGWDVLTDLARRWNLAPPGDAYEGRS